MLKLNSSECTNKHMLNVTKHFPYYTYQHNAQKANKNVLPYNIQQAKADYCHTDQTTLAYNNILLSAFYSL